MRAATSPHDFKLMVAAGGPIPDPVIPPDAEPETEPMPPMHASFSQPSPSGPPPPSSPPPGVTY
jgi:twitching motility protein PilT